MAALRDAIAASSSNDARPMCVDPKGAAALLGVSLDTFDRHVAPRIKQLRCGRKRLVPVAELQRFVAENAEFPGADW